MLAGIRSYTCLPHRFDLLSVIIYSPFSATSGVGRKAVGIWFAHSHIHFCTHLFPSFCHPPHTHTPHLPRLTLTFLFSHIFCTHTHPSLHTRTHTLHTHLFHHTHTPLCTFCHTFPLFAHFLCPLSSHTHTTPFLHVYRSAPRSPLRDASRAAKTALASAPALTYLLPRPRSAPPPRAPAHIAYACPWATS